MVGVDLAGTMVPPWGNPAAMAMAEKPVNVPISSTRAAPVANTMSSRNRPSWRPTIMYQAANPARVASSTAGVVRQRRRVRLGVRDDRRGSGSVMAASVRVSARRPPARAYLEKAIPVIGPFRSFSMPVV